MNNETFSAEAELNNLSENGISNDGSSQSSFGVLPEEIQNVLENQGFNQQESQLDQHFCLNDKDPLRTAPPSPPPPQKKKKTIAAIFG